jgi:hypothetical protein
MSEQFPNKDILFGLLKYSTYNLGDPIQSIAAKRFLPRVDRYINREALDEEIDGADIKMKLIMNGWYCHYPQKWPPARFIVPLLVSFHISSEPGHSGLRASEHLPNVPGAIEYLKNNGPVGARDLHTVNLLQSWGVDCYFSGCLTLTLKRTPVIRQEGLVVLCDVPEDVAALAVSIAGPNVQRVAHHDTLTVGVEARMRRAQSLIDLYSRASCVVTTRLHCALPCLAVGTPVLMLDEAVDKYRFSGLTELIHHCSAAELISGKFQYSFSNPPPNPNLHMPLSAAMESRISVFINGET